MGVSQPAKFKKDGVGSRGKANENEVALGNVGDFKGKRFHCQSRATRPATAQTRRQVMEAAISQTVGMAVTVAETNGHFTENATNVGEKVTMEIAAQRKAGNASNNNNTVSAEPALNLKLR